MTEASLYLLVAVAYGLIGAVLSSVYYFAPRLRAEPVFHLLTVLVMLLAGLVLALGIVTEFDSLAAFHRGAQFFLFFGATLFYVPVVVYLLLHYWEMLLERITSPGSRKEPPRAPQTQREQWERIHACLEALAADPTCAPAHERLGDLYTGMGFYDSAVYQYRKAADWMETGYAQAHVLYKATRILAERKADIAAALPLLRRIVRIYPRSYFAAYARRIISHYEAHLAPGGDRFIFPERSSHPESDGEK